MGWSTRDGVRLYHEVAGRGTPALVMIHGGGCDHTAFAPQLAHFQAGHRVVAVDLRGHGRSDAPIQEYTIPGFAEDVISLCQQLDLDKPVLIGHSLGGRIALEVVAQHPDLPAAVVAVESALLPPSGATDVPPLAAMLRTPGYREAAREFFERTLFLPTDNPIRKALLVEQMISIPQHVLASAFANTFAWDGEGGCCVQRATTLNLRGGRDQRPDPPSPVVPADRPRPNGRSPALQPPRGARSGQRHDRALPRRLLAASNGVGISRPDGASAG